jgi:hypothetical protein
MTSRLDASAFDPARRFEFVVLGIATIAAAGVKTMRMLFLFAVSLAAQFAASITAQAGDVAELKILGFTKDGGVFASRNTASRTGRC